MNAAMFLFTITNAFSKDAMNKPSQFATLSELTFVRMFIVTFASFICLKTFKIDFD